MSAGFGKQVYLNDDELLQLTLATIDQVGTSFFLIIECQKGRICYASSSIESILGYKPVGRSIRHFVFLYSYFVQDGIMFSNDI